jgi:DNA end-binding protein Ku
MTNRWHLPSGGAMARPVWNGTISFGLLNVPVQIFSGERSVDLHFRLLDSRDQKPIRYERVNSDTGEEVAWKDIVKAFEYEKGNYVVIPEQELRAAAPELTETVEIEAFVERDAISPMYFEKPYFLVPGKKAEKGYVLLRETLKKTGRIGIGKVVIRTRQYLSALMPQGDALLLNLMRFPQELVQPEQFELPCGKLSDYRVSALELKMAGQLIDSMTATWKPADYQDDFRAKLHKFVERRVAKASGSKRRDVEEAAPVAKGATNVVDFMALLKKSLAAKAQQGGKSAAPATARAKPRAPRRRAS